MGKARNFAYGITPSGSRRGRVTSDYGLFHQSNSQSRITGVQYLTRYKRITARFALFNGWALTGSARFGARDAGITYLRTAQMNVDSNNNKAFSARLALMPVSGLEIGATFFRQQLDDKDLDIFNDIMGRNMLGDPTDDDTDTRCGVHLSYDRGPFALKAEYFQGDVADVGCTWWYVLSGYTFEKFKASIYLRYCSATYDQHRVPSLRASAAWDKSQFTPLIIYHINRHAKLFFEYYVNWEDAPSGADHADNNYGFIELILFY